MPPFNRSLDWLMIADIGEEDISGITGNLERFTPQNVLWAGNTFGTRPVLDLKNTLTDLAITTTRAKACQVLDLGYGAQLTVLSTNNRGAVLYLKWDNFRMLLPMGMDFDAIDQLLLDSTMRSLSTLILAESGYTPLNPPDLIDYLHPQLAVLSVANGDKTGLPSPETIDALDGYNLLRTD
jgi:beta-lactamase superfamily II metal-dependent hydrolase